MRDTSPYQREKVPLTRKSLVRRVVVCLLLSSILVCTAGVLHQRNQRAATVDWRQVSSTLLELEQAKRELHTSLQQRLAREQTAALAN